MVEERITVIGEGVARAQPRGLDFQLVVRTRAQTAGEALDLAAKRSRILQEILRERGIAETAWHTIIASVNADRRWIEGRQEEASVAYVATGGLTVALDDPAIAGALMADAASKAGADVMGPRWRIEPDDPGWREARKRAVQDARDRATHYAEGLGLQLGPVLNVSESLHGAMRGRLPAASFAAARGELEGFDLHAGGLEMGASVEVTFRLSPA
jgi:uncharacterized protein YggE